MLRKFFENKTAGGYLAAIVMLLGVMIATAIGAIVLFAFINNIEGENAETNDTIDDIKTYAVIVFGLLVIVPLIMVGGLMLRSLGFFGGGGV